MSKRTTFTMDDAVAKVLQERASQTGKSLSSVINEALREGLGLFTVRPFKLGIVLQDCLDQRLPSEILAEIELEEDLARISGLGEGFSGKNQSSVETLSVRENPDKGGW